MLSLWDVVVDFVNAMRVCKQLLLEALCAQLPALS